MFIDEKFLRRATGLNVDVEKYCVSTFDEIGDYDAIVALSQKHGSGRGDHFFHSPKGGIYLVMRETGLNIDAHTLTPAVGLAVHDSVKTVLGRDVGLKWVNDVMYDGKKICGILIRSPRRGEYLIGVGVNYATSPAELEKAGLSDVATSLGAPEDKATAFTADLMRRIHLATLAPFDHVRYGKLCVTLGKTVCFNKNGVNIRGYAESIERDGTLLVRIGMATVAVDAGEVSLVREVVSH